MRFFFSFAIVWHITSERNADHSSLGCKQLTLRCSHHSEAMITGFVPSHSRPTDPKSSPGQMTRPFEFGMQALVSRYSYPFVVKVPEARLGDDFIGGKDVHAVDFGSRFRLCGLCSRGMVTDDLDAHCDKRADATAMSRGPFHYVFQFDDVYLLIRRSQRALALVFTKWHNLNSSNRSCRCRSWSYLSKAHTLSAANHASINVQLSQVLGSRSFSLDLPQHVQ